MISIHVPSWGTTIFCILFWIKVSISIHVPSWGTTSALLQIVFEWRYFNPRSLVGNDILNADVGNSTKDFNPRSLVGNDGSAPGCPLPGFYFNPRSLVGNDLINALEILAQTISIHVPSWGTTLYIPILCRNWEFQSTFPRGERRFCAV